MRVLVAAIAMIALIGSGCGNPRQGEKAKRGEAHEVNASNNISANSMFGPVQIQQMALQCAGRIKLAQGMATVNDSCFTGETNIVLCTDATAANPVRCSPAPGKLTVAGASDDVISYARVH